MIFPYNDYYLQYKRSFYLHAGSHVQTDFKQTTYPLVTANVTLRMVTYSWLILPDQNCFHHARNISEQRAWFYQSKTWSIEGWPLLLISSKTWSEKI